MILEPDDYPVIKEALRYLYIHHDRIDEILNEYKDDLEEYRLAFLEKKGEEDQVALQIYDLKYELANTKIKKGELEEAIKNIDEGNINKKRIYYYGSLPRLIVLILVFSLEYLSRHFMDYARCFWVASVSGPFISREMVESTLGKTREHAICWVEL